MATSTHEGSSDNGKRTREEMAAPYHDQYESKRLCDWAAYMLLNGIDDDDGKIQEDDQGVDSDSLVQMMKSLQDEIVATNPTDQPIAVQCPEKQHIPKISSPPPHDHQQGELTLSNLQDEIVATNPTDQPIAVQCPEKQHIPKISSPPPHDHQQGELTLSNGVSLSSDRKMLTDESFNPVDNLVTALKEGPSSDRKMLTDESFNPVDNLVSALKGGPSSDRKMLTDESFNPVDKLVTALKEGPSSSVTIN